MDDIKSLTVDLNIKEGRRVRGYGETAIVEFELVHPEMKGSLRFEAPRNKRDDFLKKLKIGIKKKELFEGDVSLSDVAYELSMRSTGIPLSEEEKGELNDLFNESPRKKFQIQI